MSSESPIPRRSRDDAAARIINIVMFTSLLVAMDCLCAWDIWRQVTQLLQAGHAPTADQLWRLLQPATLILLTILAVPRRRSVRRKAG